VGPLEGTRVFDFSIWAVGAFGSCILADLGADVIKVELPPAGDPMRYLYRTIGIDTRLPGGRNVAFESYNRNKKSIALNLKKPQALETALALVEQCDVFVENHRFGVTERLGLGYDSVRKVNPKIIYVSATGYGPQGPERERPALDYVGQARTGMLWMYGPPGHPPYYGGGGYADIITGIATAMAALTGLASRGVTGKGQKIDISMLGSCMWLLSFIMNIVAMKPEEGVPRLQRDDPWNALWNHYECLDGKWIALAMLQPDRYYDEFCVAVDRLDLIVDQRFSTPDARVAHTKELGAELDQVFATKPVAEWENILGQHPEFIFEQVHDVHYARQDPQVQANQYLVEFMHQVLGPVQMLNLPFGFSETPTKMRSGAPGMGEHTEEILRDVLGKSPGEISALRDGGAV
jgi:crotonobetainyl-CoA:carnitine CoA-transferase CaiB-like acyl-CoA transferase